MREIAIKILLTLSALFGVEDTPPPEKEWNVITQWKETEEAYFIFEAESDKIICDCQKNPESYIEFPTTIHSSTQVIANGEIIAETSSPDFEYARGFYGSVIIPCKRFTNHSYDKPLEWKLISYSKYFAWFKHYPRLVDSYPKDNFFKETLHVGASIILLILCLLYLVIFTGKIPNHELITLIANNLFTSIYFIGTVAGLMGLNMSMLSAHKMADFGAWFGFSFLIHFLCLEKLIKPWMDKTYKVVVLISLTIIVISKSGDSVQLGTTIPFLFTLAFTVYAVFSLIKKKELGVKKNIFQIISLLSFLISYFNDISVVTSLIDSVPLFPIGISACYIFILLSVNERITKTYSERDELKELNLKLHQANSDLKIAQDELLKSEKLAALGRAVARIAHELNNPIYIARSSAQNIVSQTRLLLENIRKKPQTEVKEHVEQYQEDINLMNEGLMGSISRAAELVRNFKEISSDQVNVQQKQFELLNYLKQSLVTMQDALTRKNIHVNLQGDQIQLYSDPGLFHQVFQNLIINVEKYAYSNEGGNIDVSLHNELENIRIVFSDYGKGIPKENLSKIFDAFFTTSGGQGGTGLGLNIVYKIVTIQLNGTITCDSSLGKGTTFTITIPKRSITKQR